MSKKGEINIEHIIVGVVMLIVAFIVTFLIVGNTAGALSDAEKEFSITLLHN